MTIFILNVIFCITSFLFFHSYDTFCKTNEGKLKQLPPPNIAVKYYKGNDLYLFDDFMAERQPGTRRPPCDNLYDVFSNIRDDEWEHVSTMKACQEFAEGKGVVSSPHDRHNSRITITSDAIGSNDGGKRQARVDFIEADSSKSKNREEWEKFASEINASNKDN